MLRRPLLRQASAAPFLMRSNGRPSVGTLTTGGHRAFHATAAFFATTGSVPPCTPADSASASEASPATTAAKAKRTAKRDEKAAKAKAPPLTHPGMEDKDAWRGPLTGKPLSAVFTKDTQTWSDSVCIGGPAAGGADGAPAVVDAATKQRVSDLAALLERRTAAGFGRSDAPKATFHDDGVRRTSVATGVEVEWPGLAAAVEKVRAALYPGEGPLTATLHNVLVYEAGDHFDWHRDMPKVPGHLATLSVECDVAGLQPPGPDAAAVVFAEEGVGADDFRVYAPRGPGDWAAWPIAMRHRAAAVPAGANRVTAIFNLARAVGAEETPLADAVAAVPATHRPAMAAVGEWMAQQRPLLWTSGHSGNHASEYDAEWNHEWVPDARNTIAPLQYPEDGTRTAIGLLLEDVIGVPEPAVSLSEAEAAQAKEEKWSKRKKAVFLNQKKVKAATESLKGKWRDLTQRDRLLYFAAVARFGEENVFLHQAKQCDRVVGSAMRPQLEDEICVLLRPFDHVFIIGTEAVVTKMREPEAHGALGNCGPEVELVYDRTVLCVTLRRPEQ